MEGEWLEYALMYVGSVVRFSERVIFSSFEVKCYIKKISGGQVGFNGYVDYYIYIYIYIYTHIYVYIYVYITSVAGYNKLILVLFIFILVRDTVATGKIICY